MLVVALLYWLFCAQVQAVLSLGISDSGGSFSIQFNWLLFQIRKDGILLWPEEGKGFRILLRDNNRKGRQRRVKKSSLRRAAVCAFRISRVEIAARIGLDDAAATARVIGMLRALISAACAAFGLREVSVKASAQLESFCFLSEVRCIFSSRLGDVMFAAVKSLLKGKAKQKEGSGWKNILLKA